MDRLEPVRSNFAASGNDDARPPRSPFLSSSDWDEEKCRNVLVRSCGHIPRNYQYGDGIQKVFLTLRDHMGDENLDLAGGVLYELIEVDCHHTDDPGASFQRWRFHHMQRHNDLELPHIPHMTTITSSVRPTTTLTRWRNTHPGRYPIRLSDASPTSSRKSADPSTVRSQKPWMIDNTMWVSSRQEGTRPVQRVNPTEFHEMQWNLEFGRGGKLVEEKIVYPVTLDGRMKPRDEQTCPATLPTKSSLARLRRNTSRKEKPKTHAKVKMAFQRGRETDPSAHSPEDDELEGAAALDKVRQSWFSNVLGFDTVVSLREFLDNREVSLPSRIPNPIFARKFGLVEKDMPFHPHIPVALLPTAEACVVRAAREACQEAALCGEAFNPSSEFRGSLTPQLWYDGGLDFSW